MGLLRKTHLFSYCEKSLEREQSLTVVARKLKVSCDSNHLNAVINKVIENLIKYQTNELCTNSFLVSSVVKISNI